MSGLEFIETPDATEETAVDRIATMLHDVAGGERADVNVYRVEPEGMVFCAKFAPDEYEAGGLDMVRRRFGPGEFEIRLYGTRPGETRYTVRAKTRVRIADDRAAVDALGGAAPGDPVARALQALADGQAQIAELIAAQRDVQRVDPLEQVRNTVELMTLMRGAMGEPSPRSSITELIAGVRELREVAGELVPGGAEKEKPGDRSMEIFQSIAGMVASAMQQRAQNPAPALAGPGRAGGPAPAFPAVSMAKPDEAAKTSQPAAAQPETDAPEVLELRAHLAALVSLASVKKPATTVEAGAELVYEKCPDEVIEFLRGEQWFDLLKTLAPDVEPHKAWFDKVRKQALTLIDADREKPAP